MLDQVWSLWSSSTSSSATVVHCDGAAEHPIAGSSDQVVGKEVEQKWVSPSGKEKSEEKALEGKEEAAPAAEEKETAEDEEGGAEEEEEEEQEEEELQDPKEKLQEACANSSACVKYKNLLDKCTERVEGGAHETCVEEFFKLQKCADHCIASKLFKKLK